MIFNCTILEVQTPQPAGPGGGVSFAPRAIRIRATMDGLRLAEQQAAHAMQIDASATLYVLPRLLPRDVTIEEGMRLLILRDGEPAARPPRLWRIARATRRRKAAGISADNLTLEEVKA